MLDGVLDPKNPPLKDGITAARAEVIEWPTLDGDVLLIWLEVGEVVLSSSLFGAGLGVAIGGVKFEEDL